MQKFIEIFSGPLCSPTTLEVKEEDPANQSATFAGN
jgi:hypothetical protein